MKAEDIEKMIRLINKLPTEEALEEAMILLNEIVSEKKKRAEFCNKNRKQKKGSTKTSTETTTQPKTVEVKEKTEFEKTLDEFIKMRKAIKKPLTEEWIKLVKQKLEKMYPWNEALQIQVLQNSISNSRQWVFPLKEGKDKIDQNSELVKQYKEQARQIREKAILDEINKYKNEKPENWTFDRRAEGFS